MAERKQLVEELFHAALAREPRERRSYLSEACSSDPSLRAEVESLISAHEEPGSFLDTPAYELAAGMIEAAPAESLIGRSLGHYEIIALLGRGGMGDVYLARDRSLDRKVALKLLPLAFTADEIRLRRFVLEARAASSLNHPNIITIHEVGQVGPVQFIATEYVEGSTLRKCFSRGRLAISEALDIATQVASALAAAHAAGIVHRDIKPENIMLRPDGYVKVLDFGLAKLTEHRVAATDTNASTAARVETDPGTIMGTTNYMSPEQARGLAVDARSDIFGLGVVLYEMLTGRLPFDGNTTADVVASILKTEPLPLNEVAPELAPHLQRITAKALRKAAADRYQTSDEILADLKKVRGELDVQSKRAPQPRSPGENPVAKAPSLVLRRLAAVLVTLLALFAGAKWLWPWMAEQNQSSSFSSLRFIELHTWKSERGEGVLDARFSHRGAMIAFTLKDRWQRIWVKAALPDAEPRLITQDESDNWWPIWSPDDQQIAFVSSRGGETGIWVASAQGGEATPLKKLTENFVRPRHWSKDGGRIYYEAENNLYSLDVVSGATTKLTAFPSARFYRHFSVSPTEDRITYIEAKDGQSDVWVATLRGGDPVQLTDDAAEDRYPSWHPDGQRIVYVSNRAGVFQICFAYLDRGKPVQVTVGGSDHRISDVSSDGTSMLDLTTGASASIFATDLMPGSTQSEVTSGLGLKFWPEVSPDGRMVAYQSTNAIGKITNSAIAVVSATGGPQVQVTSDSFTKSWSPDSSHLAFIRFANGESSIFGVTIPGGDEKQLSSPGVLRSPYSLLPSNKRGRDICWSPDGSEIAYCSRKSGAPNLWTVKADGSGETQISNNPDSNLNVYCPLWSPDGKSIVCTAETRYPRADGKKVWSLWLAREGKLEIIFEANSLLRPVDWSPPGNELIVAVDQENHGSLSALTRISLLAVTPERQQRNIRLLESAYISTVELSPDGLTMCFVSAQDGADNIWVIPAAGGEAKRVTANTDPKLYLGYPAWSPDGRTIYCGKQTGSESIVMIENFR